MTAANQVYDVARRMRTAVENEKQKVLKWRSQSKKGDSIGDVLRAEVPQLRGLQLVCQAGPLQAQHSEAPQGVRKALWS